MKNIIIIDHSKVNDFAQTPIGEKSAADIVSAKAVEIGCEIDAEVKEIAKHSDSFMNLHKAELYLKELIKTAAGYENVMIMRADAPLISVEDSIAAFEAHKKNFAFYTYGENFPTGTTAQIIKTQALEKLSRFIANSHSSAKCSLFTVHDCIFLDPNFFEIEVYLSHEDMRIHRLSFLSRSKRDFMLIQRFIDNGEPLPYTEIVKLINKKPELKRTLPAYVEIDICSANSNPPKYSYNPYSDKICVSKGNFSRTLNELEALCGDLNLSFHGYGEPLEHENLVDFAEEVMSKKNFTLFIETDAMLLSDELSNKLSGMNSGRIKTIMHLDSCDEGLYNELYPKGDYQRVMENVERQISRDPENSYIEITKMTDNFEHLESFYKHFKELGANIILRKYNSMRGLLPEKEVGDLSPFTRTACRHLERDMYIMADGSVNICKQDVLGEMPIGNIFSEHAAVIWEKNSGNYALSHKGKLDYCKGCSEWYTYNF